MFQYYGVIVGAILLTKLIFWIVYCYLSRARRRRMIQAGLIQPAPPVADGFSPPAYGNGTAQQGYQGYNAPGNYNTNYWTGAAPTGGKSCPTPPPAYSEISKTSASGELPPPYPANEYSKY